MGYPFIVPQLMLSSWTGGRAGNTMFSEAVRNASAKGEIVQGHSPQVFWVIFSPESDRGQG